MSAKPAEPRAPHNLSSSHSWTTRLVPISTSLMRLAQNADPILPRIQPACDTSSRYTSRTRKRRPAKRTRHTCRCLMFSLSSSTRLRAQRSVISRFVSRLLFCAVPFFRLRPYILFRRFMITCRNPCSSIAPFSLYRSATVSKSTSSLHRAAVHKGSSPCGTCRS